MNFARIDSLMKKVMIHGVESFIQHIGIKYGFEPENYLQTQVDIEEWTAVEFKEVTK